MKDRQKYTLCDLWTLPPDAGERKWRAQDATLKDPIEVKGYVQE